MLLKILIAFVGLIWCSQNDHFSQNVVIEDQFQPQKSQNLILEIPDEIWALMLNSLIGNLVKPFFCVTHKFCDLCRSQALSYLINCESCTQEEVPEFFL